MENFVEIRVKEESVGSGSEAEKKVLRFRFSKEEKLARKREAKKEQVSSILEVC